jgi:hypothetical protein
MHPHRIFRRLDRKREFPAAPAPSTRSCSNITMTDRPARTLHDAEDHRTVLLWCHCQPSGYHQLIFRALAGQRDVPQPVTARWGTRSGVRAPSRREWLPFDSSQVRLLEPEESSRCEWFGKDHALLGGPCADLCPPVPICRGQGEASPPTQAGLPANVRARSSSRSQL